MLKMIKKITRFNYSLKKNKDIGVLNLIFALFAGLVGITLSLLIRIQLMYPGLLLLLKRYKRYYRHKIINIKLSSIRRSNFLFNFLETNYNIKKQEILDSILFGSICLILFKLFFRLFFFKLGFIPNWYINIFIYIFFSLLALQFNFYNYIREGYVHFIAKPLLGYNYIIRVCTENNRTIPSTNRLYILSIIPQGWEHRYFHKYLYSPFNPKINYNHIYISIFNSLIYLRLLIINYFPVYIICHFFVFFFLLFNQFFLLSSLFSIIIMCSRISFFSTDYSLNLFYKNIIAVDYINSKKEIIECSWYNAKVLSSWIARSYYQRELYYIILREREETKLRIKKEMLLPDYKGRGYIDTEVGIEFNDIEMEDYFYFKVNYFKDKPFFKFILQYPYNFNFNYESAFTYSYKKLVFDYLEEIPKLIKTKPKKDFTFFYLIKLFFLCIFFISVSIYIKL